MCGEVLMVYNIRAQTYRDPMDPEGGYDSLHVNVLRLIMDVVDSAVDDCQTIEDEKVYLRHLR